MGFEDTFQRQLVPEWRIKYIDYTGLRKLVETAPARVPNAAVSQSGARHLMGLR